MKYEFKGTDGIWRCLESVTGDITIYARDFAAMPDIVRMTKKIPATAIYDAHLIAAAPDLLQACIEALEDYEKNELPNNISNKLKQAIHKALNINK